MMVWNIFSLAKLDILMCFSIATGDFDGDNDLIFIGSFHCGSQIVFFL
jgi:hypothetical protein